MENVMKARLQSVQLGEAQTYKNITILPLITPADGTFQYRTLDEALATGDIAITETTADGSVPELKVVNRASWSYASQAFSESGNLMAQKSRARKARSVQASLESHGTHKSDQGEVWQGIHELQTKACFKSPTSAMSDVYKSREDDLRQCDAIFQSVPNQIGLLAIIDGRPVGLDMLSLTAAYAKLHSKLVRSYTLEGLLDGHASPATTGEAPRPSALSPQPLALAQAFLADILTTEERQFPSVGHGTDFRYRSAPTPPKTISASQLSAFQRFPLSGSALVHANEVIHAAFFPLDEPTPNPQPSTNMASHRQRRHHTQ